MVKQLTHPLRIVSHDLRPTTWRRLLMIAVVVVACLVTGTALRLHQQSPYLIYSDSYQQLVAASQLRSHTGLVAPLGPGGSVYPAHIGWARPLLPATMAAVAAVTDKTLEQSGRLVSQAAAIALLPAVLAALYLVFKRLDVAVAGLALAALSFNASVWGGFILTDSLALVLQCALLALLAWCLRRPVATVPYREFALGLALAAGGATRFEYLLLMVPVIILLAVQPGVRRRLLGLAAGFAAGLGGCLLLAWPLRLPWQTIIQETRGPILSTAVILMTVIALYVVAAAGVGSRRLAAARQHGRSLGRACAVMTLAAGILIGWRAPGLRQFLSHDFLLAGLAIVGGYRLMRDRLPGKAPSVAYGLSLTLLAGSYLLTNPLMERYYAHLIPLLLLPAAYGSVWMVGALWHKLPVIGAADHGQKQRFGLGATSWALALIMAVLAQASVSANGLRAASDGIWFTPGYEQVAAQRLAPALSGSRYIIAAQPEPYFLASGTPTLFAGNQAPYAAVAQMPADTPLTLIDDAGMQVYFPAFHHFIRQYLECYGGQSQAISVPLRLGDQIYQPTPVRLYHLTTGQYLAALSRSPNPECAVRP